MTQSITQTQTSARKIAFDLLATNCNIERGKVYDLLKKTVCPKAATDEEIAAFAMVAGKYKLDPFVKQICAFPNKAGGVTPIVGIDGWLAIINRQPDFDGMDVDMAADGSSATCSIYVKGRSHPVRVTEYLDECKRNTEPWRTCPRRMLRHKAIMQAGRVAFNISGIYDEDEGREVAEGNAMRTASGRVVDSNPFAQYAAPSAATTQPTAHAIEEPKQAPAQEPPAEDEPADYIPGLETLEVEDAEPQVESYRD